MKRTILVALGVTFALGVFITPALAQGSTNVMTIVTGPAGGISYTLKPNEEFAVTKIVSGTGSITLTLESPSGFNLVGVGPATFSTKDNNFKAVAIYDQTNLGTFVGLESPNNVKVTFESAAPMTYEFTVRPMPAKATPTPVVPATPSSIVQSGTWYPMSLEGLNKLYDAPFSLRGGDNLVIDTVTNTTVISVVISSPQLFVIEGGNVKKLPDNSYRFAYNIAGSDEFKVDAYPGQTLKIQVALVKTAAPEPTAKVKVGHFPAKAAVAAAAPTAAPRLPIVGGGDSAAPNLIERIMLFIRNLRFGY